MSSPVVDVPFSTLMLCAGYLTGAADRHFGTRTEWTMRVYLDSTAGKMSIRYLERLETSIRERWGPGSPRLADILSKTVAGVSADVRR